MFWKVSTVLNFALVVAIGVLVWVRPVQRVTVQNITPNNPSPVPDLLAVKPQDSPPNKSSQPVIHFRDFGWITFNGQSYITLDGLQVTKGSIVPEGVVNSISQDTILIDGFEGQRIMICKKGKGAKSVLTRKVDVRGDASKASVVMGNDSAVGGKVPSYSGKPQDIFARMKLEREKKRAKASNL